MSSTTNLPKPPAPSGPVNRLDMVKKMAASGGSFGMPTEGRKFVALDLLSEDPLNERKTFRNLDGLAASIRAFGVIEAPTVIEKEGGRFQIVTGHRRYRAAKMAGLEKMEVLVRKVEEETTVRKKSIVSNVQREDVNPIELANALQGLLDDDQVETQTALAQTIGKDKTWVSKMLRILTLPAGIQEKVATSQLLVSYDAVAEIARIDNTKHQERLIDFLLTGASVQDIRQQIRQAKTNPGDDSNLPGETIDSNGNPEESLGDAPALALSKKPKYVFNTQQGASVIIQAKNAEKLTRAQQVAVLQEVLKRLGKEEA